MTKKILLGLSSILLGVGLNAQSTLNAKKTIYAPYTVTSKTNTASRSVSCGIDTVAYPFAKTSASIVAVPIENASSVDGIGQYYNCPQPIKIYGVDFFAFSNSLPSVTCQVEIYAAGPDSLRTGLALASTSINIDSSFGGGDLDTLIKHAMFSSPLTISVPYVIVFTNASADEVYIYGNDPTVNDGLGENLCSFYIGSTSLHNYDFPILGVPHDADVILMPHVESDLSTNFGYDTYCIPNTVTFVNGSSPILEDRMYNLDAFLGQTEVSYTWNFDDGSNDTNEISLTHDFTGSGPYNVMLTTELVGYSSVANCISDTTIIIDGRINIAGFKDSVDGLDLYLTDTSIEYLDTILSYAWDFGDGNTSTLMSPTHTYASTGSYTVCLVTEGACDNDTVCRLINITTTGIEKTNNTTLSVYPNPANDFITISNNTNQTIGRIEIIDVTGAKLISYSLTNQTTKIDISYLAKGIYFILNNENQILNKFIKN